MTFVSADDTPARRVIFREAIGAGVAKMGIPAPFPGSSGSYSRSPTMIAFGPDGTMFVADDLNDKIVRFDQSGRYLGAFPLPPRTKRPRLPILTPLSIQDMATDSAGILYVIRTTDMENIHRYSPDGAALKPISLVGKNIHWNPHEKSWTTETMRIGQIQLAADGSIFLRGADELVKLNQNGELLQKWIQDPYTHFVLDQHSGVVFAYPDFMVAAYDSTGKLSWKRKCGDTLSVMHDKTEKYCQIPEWIDKNGGLYWEHRGNNTATVTKTDPAMNVQGKTSVVPVRPLGFLRMRFDRDGNMYFLDASETEVWIEKVSFKSK